VNALEWMPIAGRALHLVGYSQAVEKRWPGVFIQATACVLLLIGTVVGLIM
jgi:glutathione S-transferase